MSLQLLTGRMVLRGADDVAKIAECSGLHRVEQRTVRLPSGKILVQSSFAAVRAS